MDGDARSSGTMFTRHDSTSCRNYEAAADSHASCVCVKEGQEGDAKKDYIADNECSSGPDNGASCPSEQPSAHQTGREEEDVSANGDVLVTIHSPPKAAASKLTERLNDEIWLHILRFNDFRDLLNLSRTSRRYYRLATKDELWRDLYRHYFLMQGRSSFRSLRILPRRNWGPELEDVGQVTWAPSMYSASDSDSIGRGMNDEQSLDNERSRRQIDKFKRRLQRQQEYLNQLRKDRRKLASKRRLVPFCVCCNVIGDFQQYCLTPMGFFCGLPLSLLLLCGKLTDSNVYSWPVALIPLLLTAGFMIVGFIQSLIIYCVGANRDESSLAGALWRNERHSICGRYIQTLMTRRTTRSWLVFKFGSNAIVLGGLFLGILLILLRVEDVIDVGWSLVLIPVYLAVQCSPAVAVNSGNPFAVMICTSMFCTLPLSIALIFTGLSFDGVLQWNAWEYLMPMTVSLGLVWILFLVLITAYAVHEAVGEWRCLRAFCFIWLPSVGCFTLVLGLPVLQVVFLILKADTESLDSFNYFELLSPSIVGTLILCCGWWPIGCINMVYHCVQSTALYDEGARSIYGSIDSELETIAVGD
eukprot:gb/GECG01008425.1/.p1 GENE.gb/GECG01008425.1/~~gb/GECG01008425.1/.p1  ORF type:complete len:586 (+),score=38.07 gb/GECG01008425.1/:1-1758(+)